MIFFFWVEHNFDNKVLKYLKLTRAHNKYTLINKIESNFEKNYWNRQFNKGFEKKNWQ